MPLPPRAWTFGEASAFTWRLAAIKVDNGVIYLDRDAMRASGDDSIYTLKFSEQGFSGKAVTNEYFAPFVKQLGNDIAFRQIVGTRSEQAAQVNVAGLGEEEYYWYLQRATRWDIQNDRLTLYVPTGNFDIVMYYIQ
jgi:heat shock protein HslJ